MFVSLHFVVFLLAGYNHYEIAQFLLENGSDPNAADKGGLIGKLFSY
jgi:ankyrin repeat protein